VVVGGSDGVLWKGMDAGVIDGAVNGAGRLTAAFAETLRPVQTGFVRHYALLVLAGAVAVVSYLLWS
jgi:NADH-quinone oxidoreductase subunit L